VLSVALTRPREGSNRSPPHPTRDRKEWENHLDSRMHPTVGSVT
jgi:hypothetical protein